MTKRDAGLIAGPSGGLISWLAWGAIGPAGVAIPVNWAVDKLASAAVRWFKRYRQTDDLSRLVRAAAGLSAQLSHAEIKDLRTLLEDEETWRQLSGSDVTQLTDRIAVCLPSIAREAADAIARGLLEFAVFDLQADVFQKVVQARLQQMTHQASALDEALFRMHEDLYHLVDEVKDLFRLVSDRLPPGRANLREIKIYLKGLIDWLNVDPWPRDLRLGGPVLTPAVIERKLRIGEMRDLTGDLAGQLDADADELARRCSRLVILGGPGSGKTWLAMRTARICAEEALKGLEDDATLDEVELPLYTTCSRLISTPGDIREAAVSSALNWIRDLGGSRMIKSLSLSFTEREHEPTLLVIDSLDEASDAYTARERLRQADSLKPPWRVVLTSRRSTWNNQLKIEKEDQAHRVGKLQPLRYPDDVEPVIDRWFADNPDRGQILAAQIAQRRSLQQAATVPLILAFYCILGGGQSLPEFRHNLYEQVVNRMLRGLWHPGSGPLRDAAACRETLRAWAWPRPEENHAVSGVGQWKDDIPTKDARLSSAGRAAVDHIAAPLGDPDFDTDEILRRFVHRSIREYLVAEHVASLPAEQAVQELLPHLWYDSDWEYTAAAAIARHGEHDQVLRALLCRAGQSIQVPGNLAVIDGGGEVRKLLNRVAAESKEGDWSDELARVIGEARVELAESDRVSDLGEAAHWLTSNCQIRQVLLRRLTGNRARREGERLGRALAELALTAEDKQQARKALLRQLAPRANDQSADLMAGALAQLDPTPEDKHQARDALLKRLPRETDAFAAAGLASALAQLDPTPEDKHRARDALLKRLPPETEFLAANRLAQLASALAQLDPTPEDKHRARDALLRQLAHDTNGQTADLLAGALAQLALTPEDNAQTRSTLLRQLPPETNGFGAAGLASALAQLARTPKEKLRARDTLLVVLAREYDNVVAARLVDALARLDPTTEDKRRARETLLSHLAADMEHWWVAGRVRLLSWLDPTVEDKRQARNALLRQLAPAAASGFGAAGLASALARLDPTADDKRQARNALLTQLASGFGAAEMVRALAGLDSTPEDKRQARDTLLRQLAHVITSDEADDLAEALAQLDPTLEDKRQARDALLRQLARAAAAGMVRALAGLDSTPEDKRQARDTLLRQLAREPDSYEAYSLGRTLELLDPTIRDLKSYPAKPTAELLAEVRRNSALDEWLAILPSLSPPSS